MLGIEPFFNSSSFLLQNSHDLGRNVSMILFDEVKVRSVDSSHDRFGHLATARTVCNLDQICATLSFSTQVLPQHVRPLVLGQFTKVAPHQRLVRQILNRPLQNHVFVKQMDVGRDQCLLTPIDRGVGVPGVATSRDHQQRGLCLVDSRG